MYICIVQTTQVWDVPDYFRWHIYLSPTDYIRICITDYIFYVSRLFLYNPSFERTYSVFFWKFPRSKNKKNIKRRLHSRRQEKLPMCTINAETYLEGQSHDLFVHLLFLSKDPISRRMRALSPLQRWLRLRRDTAISTVKLIQRIFLKPF
jgi:hypothetical protein